MARVHKKLAEAQFFLSKMIEQERRIFRGGDPREPFDYYLSAFLSSGRTVDYRLRHEQAAIYPALRTEWDASLKPQENSLIKFMVDDGNVEVHASGSSRTGGRRVRYRCAPYGWRHDYYQRPARHAAYGR